MSVLANLIRKRQEWPALHHEKVRHRRRRHLLETYFLITILGVMAYLYYPALTGLAKSLIATCAELFSRLLP